MRIIIGAAILVAVFSVFLFLGLIPNLNSISTSSPIKKVIQNIPGQEFDLDKEKSIVDLNKLRQGCPVKDCIPAIDSPKFISADHAEEKGWIDPMDIVFALYHKGVAKAYPQRILNWHEIVNDKIGDDAVVVTFCPLCGTAIAYVREIKISGEEKETTFGVSGKLINSNLIMYDRVTNTLWQQLGGEAIVGELVGQKLETFPIDTLFWKDWKKIHPETQILSQDTGFDRDYSLYPYGSYENDNSVYFPADGITDERLHPKEIVWGITVEGQAKAYPDKKLTETGDFIDNVGGIKVKILRNKEGQVRITKTADGSLIIPDRSMWFAWVSFYPETELY